MELAHYCMDNPIHIFSGKNLDGIRCPYCNGLVNIKPVTKEEYEKLPKYREIKKNKKYRYKAQCLVCEHTEMVHHESKEDYQEVTVCPECKKGALVDMWKINKYLQTQETI